MKKIVALIVCMVLLCTISVSALAENKVPSPEIKAMLRKGIGVEVILSIDTWYDVSGNVHVKVKTDEGDYGKFNFWSFYKTDGSKATEGTDYELVSSITSETVEFICHTGIIVCANYNGETTDPLKPSKPDKPVNPDKPVEPEKPEEKSDKTGDFAIPVASVLLLAGAAFTFVSKKVFSE